MESINNIYDIPSIEPAIWYLNGAAGFSTKVTSLKSIQKGNYLILPPINAKNVKKIMSWRKLKKDICATNSKDYGPP